jgi:heme-degrading monooxygenase HmoA
MGGTMIYALAIQKIKDYDKWKQVFDEHSKVRKDEGSNGAIIYRNSNDPKELVIITEWKNMESAKNFSLSEDLNINMKKAGVIGLPELHYLEQIEKTEY